MSNDDLALCGYFYGHTGRRCGWPAPNHCGGSLTSADEFHNETCNMFVPFGQEPVPHSSRLMVHHAFLAEGVEEK